MLSRLPLVLLFFFLSFFCSSSDLSDDRRPRNSPPTSPVSSLPLLLPRLRRVGTTVAASSAAPPFFFVFPDQHRRRGFVCYSRRRRPPDQPLPPHHRHDRLLRPRLLFLPDPPSASLLSLCSTGDLPGSLFFLRCRSSSTGAAVAGSVVLPPESLRSPSPCFPPMPPATAHFFSLRFLLRDAVAVILIAVALLCLGDAFPPPFSSSLSPSAPAP